MVRIVGGEPESPYSGGDGPTVMYSWLLSSWWQLLADNDDFMLHGIRLVTLKLTGGILINHESSKQQWIQSGRSSCYAERQKYPKCSIQTYRPPMPSTRHCCSERSHTLRDWTWYLVRLKVFASALRIDFIYNMTCGKGGFEVLGVSHVLRTKEMAFDVMNGYTMTFILNSASYNWKKATCARL